MDFFNHLFLVEDSGCRFLSSAHNVSGVAITCGLIFHPSVQKQHESGLRTQSPVNEVQQRPYVLPVYWLTMFPHQLYRIPVIYEI